VGPVEVLVSHDHDAALAQLADLVGLVGHQPHDAHQIGDFLVALHFLVRSFTHI